MTLLDAVILYLAFGSPFAVYEATKRRAGSPGQYVRQIAGALFLWPVLTVKLVQTGSLRYLFESNGQQAQLLEEIRNELESKIVRENFSKGVFEFRETFYRFAGLEDASTPSGHNGSFELFKIVGHPDARLASRILARKNLSKIREHRRQAMSDLLQIVNENSIPDNSEEIENILLRLSPGLRLASPNNLPDESRREMSSDRTVKV